MTERRGKVSKKGIYVEMAHHPQVVLDSLEQVDMAVGRATFRQQLLRLVPIAFIVIGLLSIALTFLLSEGNQGQIYRVAGFLLAFLGVMLLSVLRGQRNPMLREHFEAARQILHTLRDDTGRKGRVVGWLDLSGPQQKEKTMRRARSLGGKQKVYYRDPWFKVKFKLVDGNLLRLTLEDKVKTKAGSVVRHSSQFAAKLVVNPELYHLVNIPPGGIPTPNVNLLQEDGVFVVKAAGPAKEFSAEQVLETLKAVYSHLEPIWPRSIAGVEALGPEV
jgi:hypothetical protein